MFNYFEIILKAIKYLKATIICNPTSECLGNYIHAKWSGVEYLNI